MPPYKAVTSKSQSRALFAKARRGEGISMEDARGKTRAADFSSLPERKGSKRGKRPAKRPTVKRAASRGQRY